MIELIMGKVNRHRKNSSVFKEVEIFGRFPNNEIYPKNKIGIFRSDVLEKQIVWYYEDSKLYEDLFKIEMLSNINKNFELVIGFLPYSRSDKPFERDIFMLKFISDKLTKMNFKNIRLCEPHSDMSNALLKSSNINITRDIYEKMYKDTNKENEIILVYPDLGATKRYKNRLIYNKNEISCIKDRDSLGNIKYFELLNVKNLDLNNKQFVIVDDLCSKGGTFIEIIECLKKYNPQSITLIVTHTEENIFNGQLLDNEYLTEILTSNSIMRSQTHKKIKEIINISDY